MKNYLKNYLCYRKTGELVNELYHLKKDIVSEHKFTVSRITQKTHDLEDKNDIIIYHLDKIKKIINSDYFVSSEEIAELLNKIVEDDDVDNIYNNTLIALKTIKSSSWVSIYYLKLNVIEWLIVLIIVILVYNIFLKI